MAALANNSDYEALTGVDVEAGAETTRIERLLELASAAVERWCNRTFGYVEDDEITVHVDDGTLFLPNGPIAEVTSIVGPSSPWLPDAAAVDPAGWQEVRGHVLRRYGWWCPGAYTVTYTHGYETVPDAIILAVCQVVKDFLDGPGAPLVSESIGEVSFSYEPGAAAMRVGAAAAGLLRSYRVAPTSVLMAR